MKAFSSLVSYLKCIPFLGSDDSATTDGPDILRSLVLEWKCHKKQPGELAEASSLRVKVMSLRGCNMQASTETKTTFSSNFAGSILGFSRTTQQWAVCFSSFHKALLFIAQNPVHPWQLQYSPAQVRPPTRSPYWMLFSSRIRCIQYLSKLTHRQDTFHGNIMIQCFKYPVFLQ